MQICPSTRSFFDPVALFNLLWIFAIYHTTLHATNEWQILLPMTNSVKVQYFTQIEQKKRINKNNQARSVEGKRRGGGVSIAVFGKFHHQRFHLLIRHITRLCRPTIDI